jgi:hypothetical protein
MSEPVGVAHAIRRLPALTAGFVAFIGTALGVLFVLVPSLRPLPRDRIEASLSVPAIENHVGVKEWATRQFPKDTGRHLTELLHHRYGPHDREGTGTIVFVRLSTVGFQHRSLNLRVVAIDPRQQAAPKDVDITTTFPLAGTLRVDAPSRQSVQLLFIDDLGYVTGVPLFLRVEAYDDHGVLAYADSSTIVDGVMRKVTAR